MLSKNNTNKLILKIGVLHLPSTRCAKEETPKYKQSRINNYKAQNQAPKQQQEK